MWGRLDSRKIQFWGKSGGFECPSPLLVFYSLKQGHQKSITSYVEVFMSLLEYFATIETFANLTANPVQGALHFCIHQGLFKEGWMQDSNLNKGV